MTSSMAAAAAAPDPYMSSYYMTSTPYQVGFHSDYSLPNLNVAFLLGSLGNSRPSRSVKST
ncbi:hypothetical protein E2C01_052513 [Portunus trituberculatus]|uniref:Uncharacterized protein n=1 Tax=Portunus trituberculatus TaxID=210409 RepID=A0A5B7GMN6_PORTR|nr:hypothetical protein [Portunus trituberculatus]